MKSTKNPSLNYAQNAILQKIIATKLVGFIQTSNTSSILDIGSGTGFIAQKLIEKGFSSEKILQIDSNNNSLLIAQQFSQTQYTDFNSRLNFNQKFDIITSSMSLQWAQDFNQTLANIRSLLAKNGTFIFAIPLNGSLHEIYNIIQIPHFSLPTLESLPKDIKLLERKRYRENAFITLKNIHLCGLKLDSNRNNTLSKEVLLKCKNTFTYWDIGWFELTI